jgi:hypothetical protein
METTGEDFRAMKANQKYGHNMKDQQDLDNEILDEQEFHLSS